MASSVPSRRRRISAVMTGAEWRRMGGMAAFILALHIIGWFTLVAVVAPEHHTVGTKTFGKGSVQVDYHLSDGGDLHLTVEHWFLPNGRSIDGVGLNPDVPVDLTDKPAMFAVVQPARGHAGDAQLNRGLQAVAAP